MKQLKYIVENFTQSEDYEDLVKAVRDSGRQCQVVDRKNNFDIDFSRYEDGDLVLFQGSIQGTRRAKEKLPNCSPVALCTDANYDCLAYYPKLQKHLFNDKHVILDLKTVKENKWELYHKFGREAMIFVRPTRGDKTFTGQLLDLQDFDRVWNNAVVCNADDKDMIVVSTPKTIQGEWRFVVSAEGIIAQSTYAYQGKSVLIPSAPKGATAKCLEIIKEGYHPDTVYCIDICEDFDGNFWLLELTSFSSAGLYATNKRAIVDEVSRIIETKYSS